MSTKMVKRILCFLLVAMTILTFCPIRSNAYQTGKTGESQSISASYGFTAVIDSDGTLWTCGYNNYGQLGNGTTVASSSLVRIMEQVASVSCSDLFAAAIKKDGSLWMWGSNENGQIGNGGKSNAKSQSEQTAPVPIQSVPVKVMDNVAAVSCGYSNVAAVKTDGTLWTWGSGYDLGFSGDANARNENGLPVQNIPKKIMDGVVSACMGFTMGAAIKSDGSLWMWGRNNSGQFGIGRNGESKTPIKVLDQVSSVACDNNGGVIAVKIDGTLLAWGQLWKGGPSNKTGQYGITYQDIPVQIMSGVSKISCSNATYAAIKTDGTLWMWGVGYNGRESDSASPRQIMAEVADISCGMCHAVAVKTNGSVWTWGENRGQLGYQGGDYTNSYDDGYSLSLQTVPRQISGIKAQIGEIAYAQSSSQIVNIDGKPVIFAMYALDNGSINYIRVRDLAVALNGTAAQFDVDWDGSVVLSGGKPYTGSSDKAPFTGDMPYSKLTDPTNVNGRATSMDAIKIEYQGGGYTFYKLRDLAQALGFNVGWDDARGIYIETGRSYDPSN